jgi:hypothetical protein
LRNHLDERISRTGRQSAVRFFYGAGTFRAPVMESKIASGNYSEGKNTASKAAHAKPNARRTAQPTPTVLAFIPGLEAPQCGQLFASAATFRPH